MELPGIPRSEEEYRHLVAAGESEVLELKTRLPWSDYLVGRTIAAFANTRGGLLLIGVSDKGELAGLTRVEAEHNADRLRRLVASLLPYPTAVDVLDLPGGSVVAARVPPAAEGVGPIATSSGEIFQRSGTTETAELPQSPPRAISAEARRVTAFVAMSFREEEEPSLVDYYAAIERAARRINLPIEIVRMDSVTGDYEISQQILQRIDACDIVIADFTLGARNVYFELGYARGRRKRTIQTARRDTILEFDVRQWRTLFYRNATELEEALIAELLSAYRDVAET